MAGGCKNMLAPRPFMIGAPRPSKAAQVRVSPECKVMKTLSLFVAATLALSSAALAGAKLYQVTGPVVDVNDKMITVMKGSEKWEIDRDANTKVNGDVKAGDKVTVHYTMTAKDVEVKAGKKDEKASPSASPKK
jgi:hypothetical protein